VEGITDCRGKNQTGGRRPGADHAMEGIQDSYMGSVRRSQLQRLLRSIHRWWYFATGLVCRFGEALKLYIFILQVRSNLDCCVV
jgi:hypothetical protein